MQSSGGRALPGAFDPRRVRHGEGEEVEGRRQGQGFARQVLSASAKHPGSSRQLTGNLLDLMSYKIRHFMIYGRR